MPPKEAPWAATELDELHATPLDEIRPDEVKDMVARVRRDKQAPVEVARFGSAI